MEKICFVVCQYGKEVNGGGELHCKMLAERLTPYFDVDILTSKIINYKTFEAYYTHAIEIMNGTRILRFDCEPYNPASHKKWLTKAKWPRKIRRNLFRLGLLRAIANIFPVWNCGIKQEQALLRTDGFYSPDMLAYLRGNHDDYKAIIFISYPFPHTLLGSLIAPEKSILIPTAHDEGDLFRSIQTHVFTGVRHIAFNTEEERSLTQNIFGKHLAPSSIVAVGVETEVDTPFSSDKEMREKFNLPNNYIHYFGRIVKSKLGNLIPWFIDYKRKYPSDLKLVLTGKLFQPKIDHPDIVYTGFVSMEEKIFLIKNARLVVNPSKNESLSLLQLEAMKLGKTVLVNGKSEVMKGHCMRSGFAADYYLSKQDFQQKVHQYAFDDELLENNNIKAKNYVDTFYNWDTIIAKLKAVIDTI